MLQDVVGDQNLTNLKEKSFREKGGIGKKRYENKAQSESWLGIGMERKSGRG